QATVQGALREGHIGTAALRALSRHDEDLAGITHHTRLDAHAHPRLAPRLDSPRQALPQATGKLIKALPRGHQLTRLRALTFDTQAIVLKQLTCQRPHFCRNPLRHQPTSITATL